jgi:hypothetical protein
MISTEIMTVCENDKKHRNTLCGQNAKSLMLKQAIQAVTTGLSELNFKRTCD